MPLVHLGVGQGVQGDRAVAGAARPAAQRHLLGHRAAREERGGLRAEQGRYPLLQVRHDPVAVDVHRPVQVVHLGCRLLEGCQPLPHGAPGSLAREHAFRLREGGQPPLPHPLLSGLLRLLLFTVLGHVGHARIMPRGPARGQSDYGRGRHASGLRGQARHGPARRRGRAW